MGATSSPPPRIIERGGEISLLELLNVLLRRRRLALCLPLATALLTGVVAFLLPVWYSAKASFVPEAPPTAQLPGGLAGLASQVGLTLGAEPSQSPDFYSRVLRSRELLERILLTRYLDPRSTETPVDSITFMRILRVNGDDEADSLHNGVKALDKLLSVDVDDQTNIVTFRVDAPSPELAAQVAKRFIEYLNDFNTHTRQSRAGERRKFIEQRLSEGESDLHKAEEDLRTFYERNRSWQGAPQLVFEEGRLHRRVEIRQDLYLTLSRQYQSARIEEVNDTPVITVVDHPVPPTEKARPKRALLIVLGFFLGGIVAIIYATGAEYFNRAKREKQLDYDEFKSLLARTTNELRHLFRGRSGSDKQGNL